MVKTEPTVFIVDDDAVICDGISQLVETVGLKAKVFTSAQEFLDSYDANWQGCLVLDVRMPGMSGLQLQDKLVERVPDFPIIFITGHANVRMGVDTVKKGAVDFIEKPFDDQILLDKIQTAIAKVLRERDAFALRNEAIERLQQLSDREKQVLDLVMAGKPNKVIAADLGLSQSTIEVHRANIMKKMKVDSLPQLVTLANMAREKN